MILSYCSEEKCPQAILSKKCLIHEFLKEPVSETENHYVHKIIEDSKKPLFVSNRKSFIKNKLNKFFENIWLKDATDKMKSYTRLEKKKNSSSQHQPKLEDFWKSVYSINEIMNLLSLLRLELKSEDEILNEYNLSAEVLKIWTKRYTPENHSEIKTPTHFTIKKEYCAESQLSFKEFLPKPLRHLNSA
ncbi:hypothetical protein [Chryseobacterium scophthalmum]|uniref:hypothetical protein n=1 Tax=Chryseobacterium scophthalmum TaxID=59733 RepID=UPI003D033AF3